MEKAKEERKVENTRKVKRGSSSPRQGVERNNLFFAFDTLAVLFSRNNASKNTPLYFNLLILDTSQISCSA